MSTLSENYKALQNQLENSYVANLQLLKSQAFQAEVHRQVLENDNKRCLELLSSYKQVQQQGDDLELLAVEIQSMNNQLASKRLETEEWRTLLHNLQLQIPSMIAVSNEQFVYYETQIKLLLSDIDTKQREVDTLRLINQNLKLPNHNYNLECIKMQLTQKDIENAKLKTDLLNQINEGKQIEKNESQLIQQESQLKNNIELLNQQIEQKKREKVVEEEEAVKKHRREVQDLQDKHQATVQAMNQQKEAINLLIQQRDQAIAQLNQETKNLAEDISEIERQRNQLKDQVENQMKECENINQTKERELAEIDQECNTQLETIKRSHKDKSDKYSKDIADLTALLNLKEQALKQTELKVLEEKIEVQKALENTNILSKSLEKQQNYFSIKQTYHQSAEKQKDNEIVNTINTLKQSCHRDEDLLKNNSQLLEKILLAKNSEIISARQQAVKYSTEAQIAAQKEREKSVEAQVWQTKYAVSEKQRLQEVDAARFLRQSQVLEASRRGQEQLIVQDRVNQHLAHTVRSKQDQVNLLQCQNVGLTRELVYSSAERRQAELNNIVVQDNLRNSQIQAEVLHQQNNQALISSQIATGSVRAQALANAQALRNSLAKSYVAEAELRANNSGIYRSRYI